MGLFKKSRKKDVRKTARRRSRRNTAAVNNTEMINAAQKTFASKIGEDSPVQSPEEARKAMVKADPSRVFHYFREISAIPRGSHHTKAISDYLAD